MISLSKAAHVTTDIVKEDENRNKLPTSFICAVNLMWKKQKSKSKHGLQSKGAGRQGTRNSHLQRKGNFSLLNVDSNGLLPQRSFRVHSFVPAATDMYWKLSFREIVGIHRP